MGGKKTPALRIIYGDTEEAREEARLASEAGDQVVMFVRADSNRNMRLDESGRN
jgi:hypothetical protein